jgi:hypothetical protein
MELNKVSLTTTIREINEMIKFGYLKKVGSFKGAYYILDNEAKQAKK